MLYADKAALENRTKVRLLSIRERELTLYTNNCRTVGTVSALMAGIAYSALIYTKMAYFQESSIAQQFCYITGLVVCMCLSLRNVLGTTMLTMLGPGKALRGPDGSMHAAVDGMLDAFDGISYVQHLTVYSFMATSVVYAWGAASMSVFSSVLLTTLIAGMTYVMHVQSGIVERAFPMRLIPLVSGAFFAGGDGFQTCLRRDSHVRSGFWGSRYAPVSTVASTPSTERSQLPASASSGAGTGSRVVGDADPSAARAHECRQQEFGQPSTRGRIAIGGYHNVQPAQGMSELM